MKQKGCNRKKSEVLVQDGEKHGHLGPGQAGSGTEGAVSVALEEALCHGPGHGGLGVILHLVAVCKGLQVCTLDSFLFQVFGDIPVQEGGCLLAGDGSLGLEGGGGYYYFTRKESKVDLERKLEAIQKWIDYLSFLKTYHSAFGPGFLFRAADIEIQIGCDIELKEKATKLFSDKKKYDEVVGKLLKELESIGLIEKENELDGTYKVLSAFHYMEDLVDCITISEEVQDEIPE